MYKSNIFSNQGFFLIRFFDTVFLVFVYTIIDKILISILYHLKLVSISIILYIMYII